MTEEVTDTVVDTAPAPTAPENTTTETAPENKAFAVPDAYKEKGWASKIKSEEDLYKQIDNLSSLVGKKEVFKPTNWEDENSRNEYYKSMRPEKAEDYALPEVFEADEIKAYQSLLHENGISKYQAEQIFGKLAEMRSSAFDGESMTNELKESWGADVGKKTDMAMKGLKTYANEKDLALFDKMPNPVLSAVYRTMVNMLEKHGAKESDIAASNPSNPQKVDLVTQRNTLLKQIMDENNKPSVDWTKVDNLKKQLSETYKVG